MKESMPPKATFFDGKLYLGEKECILAKSNENHVIDIC